jgi:hypothetical protein
VKAIVVGGRRWPAIPTPTLLTMKRKTTEASPNPAGANPTTASAPLTIGFRLDAEARDALNGRAAVLNMSVHELSRRYVIESLAEPEERAALSLAVEDLRKEIGVLRQDISDATLALLVCAGHQTEETARAWVNENLGCPCSPSQTP